MVEIQGGPREEDTEVDTGVNDNIVVTMKDEEQAKEEVNKDEDTEVSDNIIMNRMNGEQGEGEEEEEEGENNKEKAGATRIRTHHLRVD